MARPEGHGLLANGPAASVSSADLDRSMRPMGLYAAVFLAVQPWCEVMSDGNADGHVERERFRGSRIGPSAAGRPDRTRA